jgi:hypothetical protein
VDVNRLSRGERIAGVGAVQAGGGVDTMRAEAESLRD